jgi:hypothetical protein
MTGTLNFTKRMVKTLEIIYLIIGVALGLMVNGVKITIIHKDEPKDHKNQQYNKSPIDAMPQEVTEYAKQNKGFINF